MSTPTTTPQLIREQQVALIEALSPTQLGNTPFRQYKRTEPFADWTDSAPASAFRTFYLQDLATYETPLTGDYETEEVTTEFQLQVAYPLSYQYGSDGIHGLNDIIEQDRLQIERAIGIYGGANYVSGQNRCALTEYELDRDGPAWLSISTFEINFRRAV